MLLILFVSEGLGAGGEGDDRGWDGWMASLTQWMWVSVNSGSWWWTGRPGVLRFMGSQRVGHDWATDLIWSDDRNIYNVVLLYISSLCSVALCWWVEIGDGGRIYTKEIDKHYKPGPLYPGKSWLLYIYKLITASLPFPQCSCFSTH